jgi:Reverse transcriptase (RNA-dependent DNA polymerase)/Integrase core domain
LISIRKITEKRLSVVFTNDECRLVSPNGNNEAYHVLARYEAGAYQVIMPKSNCAVAKNDAETGLCVHEWHRKLAHRHLSDVKRMAHLGVVFKKCFCSNICDACIRGKMSRLPFPPSSEKFTESLDCVSTDVCGPMQVQSIGHSKYFITFNDLFTGYSEVFFMRQKSETSTIAIQFIEKMKTQFGRKIKILRSDQGGEYTCHSLQNYLKNEGIRFQSTVAYTPQQNGNAERKNRTLVESARTMLRHASLPQTFWAEAVHHANHVFNRIPNASNVTLYELFLIKKPKIDFHEFGSDIYVMIPYEKRRKLDNKAEATKFLSWDDQAKGYRVVDARGVIRVSRDIKFIESERDAFQNVFLGDSSSEEEPSVSKNDSDNKILDESVDVHEENAENPEDTTADDDTWEDVQDTWQQVDEILAQKEKEALVDSDNSVHESLKSTPEPVAEPRITRSKAIKSKESGMFTKLNAGIEPKTYQDAINSADSEKWKKAMDDELFAIESSKTWCLTDLPQNCKPINCKWVYKIKRDEKGQPVQYKARLVAIGFTQKYGVDYDEVLAPVVRSATIRILLSFAGKKSFLVKHFDIKSAFLNGNLEEEIYMRQPQGFKFGEKVYKLNKSLYGLKQAARVWNQTLHDVLVKANFIQCKHDKCLYVLSEQEKVCYLLVHVDDILMASNSESLINCSARKIGAHFEVKDLGEIKHFLGIDITKDEKGNFLLSQKHYIKSIIEAAGLQDSKDSKYPLDVGYYKIIDESKLNLDEHCLYRKLIGMLFYLTTNSRPDINASISILSQHVSNPTKTDMNEVKRVIKYLKGTIDLKLCVSQALGEQQLVCFSDANWAEDRSTRKSNSGYFLKVNGGAISWSCRKQGHVTLSSTEAEHVAINEACKEAVWIKNIVDFFDGNLKGKLMIRTDSQSCIKMIQNDRFSNLTKHIDVRFHFVKDLFCNGDIYLEYVKTENNTADLFTKPLGPTRVKYLRQLACLN